MCQIGIDANVQFQVKNEGCTPQLKAYIRFRFHVRQVSVHSPRTASSQRRRKRRNPIVSLMIPITVSTVDLCRALLQNQSVHLLRKKFAPRQVLLRIVREFCERRLFHGFLDRSFVNSSILPQWT